MLTPRYFHGSYVAIAQIYRTGEIEEVRGVAAHTFHAAHNPVGAPRPVVDIHGAEFGSPVAFAAEPFRYSALASLHGAAGCGYTPAGVHVSASQRIHANRPDLAVFPIQRTRKLVLVRAPASVDDMRQTPDKVVIVIHSRFPEFDVGRAVALGCLTPHGFLALPDDAPSIERFHASLALSKPALPRKTVTAPVAPLDFERVSFRAAIGILDPHHSRATLPGIPDQRLPAAAVDAAETKVHWIRRQDSRAFKAAELRRLSGDIAQISGIAANFDVGGAIHHYLHDASAAGIIAAADDPRALLHLCEGRHNGDPDRRYGEK